MIKGESLKRSVSVIAPGSTYGEDRDVREVFRGGKTALKLVPGFFLVRCDGSCAVLEVRTST